MDCAHQSRPRVYKGAAGGGILRTFLGPGSSRVWTVVGDEERLQVISYWRNNPYFPSPPPCLSLCFLPLTAVRES